MALEKLSLTIMLIKINIIISVAILPLFSINYFFGTGLGIDSELWSIEKKFMILNKLKLSPEVS